MSLPRSTPPQSNINSIFPFLMLNDFDPYSISSMSEAITKVIYNEEKRSQLIRLGNERLKRYSWEKAAQKTEEAYQKAIQS